MRLMRVDDGWLSSKYRGSNDFNLTDLTYLKLGIQWVCNVTSVDYWLVVFDMSFVQRYRKVMMIPNDRWSNPLMGLSENSVPLNSLVNRYLDLQSFVHICTTSTYDVIAMTAMTEVPEVLPNMQTSDVDRDDKTNIMRLETRWSCGSTGHLRHIASTSFKKTRKNIRSMCLLHGTWQDWICEFELICPLVTSSYGMSMNVTMSDRQIIYSWAIFYSYVRIPEGITMHDLDQRCHWGTYAMCAAGPRIQATCACLGWRFRSLVESLTHGSTDHWIT